ncbi:RNA polymerase sigma factor [Paractinoplanes durhamensis]|uniref:RNA polymerase sigma-70 region 2 domain-containing protein n=1 Tax=Paractinoplanes durhamensis TaxID=113563 RepID=A0ABQ3Z6Y5_9ACTN|nr:hypothetical protein [Actinoplanes durhamensis]GIE05573.1 hypothetical protein Adu01nite_69230 [Actinoplanes durhamensis]
MQKFSRLSAEFPAIDFQQLSDSALVELISRGNTRAFAALVDRTVAAVRAALPVETRINEILASSYVEVWWLAGCRPAPESDVTSWITGIVRRRAADASRGRPPDGADDALRPSTAELELATILGRPVGAIGVDVTE